MKLNEEFWEDRWANNMTKWDVGRATPPITTFMSTYPNKDAHILFQVVETPMKLSFW